MIKKNIYRIDGIMISVGLAFTIIGFLTIFLDPRVYNELTFVTDGKHYSFEDFNGRTLEEIKSEKKSNVEVKVNKMPIIRPIIALNGIIFLAIGFAYRKKENKIISIWDAIERSGGLKIDDLIVNLGLSRDFILKSLKEINAQKGVFYMFDSDHNKIVDSRLMEEVSVSKKCSNCGNSVSGTVSMHALKPINCNYCGVAIEVEQIKVLKEEKLVEINTKIEEFNTKNFSPLVFGVLLFTFWPGAIFYYFIKKSK